MLCASWLVIAGGDSVVLRTGVRSMNRLDGWLDDWIIRQSAVSTINPFISVT